MDFNDDGDFVGCKSDDTSKLIKKVHVKQPKIVKANHSLKERRIWEI